MAPHLPPRWVHRAPVPGRAVDRGQVVAVPAYPDVELAPAREPAGSDPVSFMKQPPCVPECVRAVRCATVRARSFCAWDALRACKRASERGWHWTVKGGKCQSPSPVQVELTLRIGHSTSGQSAAVITTSSASAFLFGGTYARSQAKSAPARARAYVYGGRGHGHEASALPIPSSQRVEPATASTFTTATEQSSKLGTYGVPSP
jgi:hypothetical protein